MKLIFLFVPNLKCFQVEYIYIFSFLYFNFGEVVGFSWVFGLEFLEELGVEVFIMEECLFSLKLLVYKLFGYICYNFSNLMILFRGIF